MDPLIGLFFFIFGSLVGSFLNVVILRLPLKQDIVYKRSHCTQCQTQLKWFHNIPVLSYIFLRGKCSFCSKRISWRYPLIEILMGLVAVWLAPPLLTAESISLFIFYFSIASAFVCHFVIDLDHHLLLDSINLYLLGIFLIFAVFSLPWSYWVIGGAIGFLLPLGVTWIFYKVRGQVGLGGGDIKLFGVLGVFLGPVGIMFTIFMSCFVGAIIGLSLIATGRMTKDKPMAFGPSILIVSAFQIFFPRYASYLQSFFF